MVLKDLAKRGPIVILHIQLCTRPNTRLCCKEIQICLFDGSLLKAAVAWENAISEVWSFQLWGIWPKLKLNYDPSGRGWNKSSKVQKQE